MSLGRIYFRSDLHLVTSTNKRYEKGKLFFGFLKRMREGEKGLVEWKRDLRDKSRGCQRR